MTQRICPNSSAAEHRPADPGFLSWNVTTTPETPVSGNCWQQSPQDSSTEEQNSAAAAAGGALPNQAQGLGNFLASLMYGE